MSARKTARPKTNNGAERRRWSTRGQAMVEYSLVTHFILLGGSIALMPVMISLYDALSLFYESLYFVLSTGAV